MAFFNSAAGVMQTPEFMFCASRSALMLIIIGCIIFTIMRHIWNSMAIMIVIEVFPVLIIAGAVVIEDELQMASESFGGFMRT